MSFWNRFPYTDYNDINLDWILDQMKMLLGKLQEIEQQGSYAGLAQRITDCEDAITQLQQEVETPTIGLLDRMTQAESDIQDIISDISAATGIYWLDVNDIDADKVNEALAAHANGSVVFMKNGGDVFFLNYVAAPLMYFSLVGSSGSNIHFEFIQVSNVSPFIMNWDVWGIPSDIEKTSVVLAGSTKLITSGGVADALDLKQDVLTFDSVPTPGSTNPVDSDGIAAALALKQDVLTFDSAPTDGSTNPVESDGIYDALQLKQDVLTFDNTPTQDSTNPVTSGGVYQAILDASFAGVTFDNTPTEDSVNPVTSDGIYNALHDLIHRDSFLISAAASYSLAAGAEILFNEDVTVSDYDCLGIVGLTVVGTDSKNLIINRFYVSSNLAYVRVCNPTNAAITITNLRINTLYVKS